MSHHPDIDTPLVDRFDAFLFDLDGVVYIGPDPVAHAAEALSAIRAAGRSCVFVTNNANRPAVAVAAHLGEIGIPAAPDEVVTSPQAAVSLLPGHVADGAAVLVVGGEGIDEALVAGGYRPVRDRTQDPAAVVQGYSPDVSWRELAMAAYAVADGLPWIATNLDKTIPTPDGIAPGNGTLVAAVAAAVGREPDVVAGKPAPPLLRAAISRVDATAPLMVGDRLDTDIAAGPRAGVPTMLVLTGVTTLGDLLAAGPDERPDFVAADLRAVLEPYPTVHTEATPAGLVVRLGTLTVSAADGEISVDGSAAPAHVAHAVAIACWHAADAGRGPDLARAVQVLVDAAPELAGRAGNVIPARMEAGDARRPA